MDQNDNAWKAPANAATEAVARGGSAPVAGIPEKPTHEAGFDALDGLRKLCAEACGQGLVIDAIALMHAIKEIETLRSRSKHALALLAAGDNEGAHHALRGSYV